MRAPAGVVVALALLLALLAGCEPADDEPAEAATSEEDSEADPEGDAEPGPSGEPGPEPVARAPLTGLPLEEEGARDLPVVALKVDNAVAARPQVGLEDAEIVLTELVEGGTTRFAALYQTATAELVGPVRSAREADAELLPPFEPVFASSGAAEVVLGLLRDTGMVLREEAQPPDAWHREPARRAPHNLFAAPALLAEDAPDGWSGSPPWPISDNASADGQGDEVERLTLDYSSSHQVSWEPQGDQWLRSQDGAPHESEDGERLSATNVVIARIDVRDGDRTDAAGNPVVDMTVEGSGEALVLMGGRAVAARWEREPGGHFSWTTPEGEPIELRPGSTWIELLPDGRAVETLPSAVG